MPRKSCLFWIVCIGLLFSDMGMTQSRKKLGSEVNHNTLVSARQPWFPYMTTSTKTCRGSDNLQAYSIGDTLLTQPPPDSVEIVITTSQGDYEKIWLGHQYFPDWRPGVVLYGGTISVGENDPPVPGDGILQIDSREPGFKKIFYRSFNDLRLYTCRFEWCRILLGEDER